MSTLSGSNVFSLLNRWRWKWKSRPVVLHDRVVVVGSVQVQSVEFIKGVLQTWWRKFKICLRSKHRNCALCRIHSENITGALQGTCVPVFHQSHSHVWKWYKMSVCFISVWHFSTSRMNLPLMEQNLLEFFMRYLRQIIASVWSLARSLHTSAWVPKQKQMKN